MSVPEGLLRSQVSQVECGGTWSCLFDGTWSFDLLLSLGPDTDAQSIYQARWGRVLVTEKVHMCRHNEANCRKCICAGTMKPIAMCGCVHVAK